MAKDPAFLFYSNDFYEGTRTMLPEERACYIDLMIYQHQRGFIPNDLKRVLLYCNGIDEATLKATLEAKFKLTDKGWINEKLESIIELRQEYSSIQSINGTIGQFWKKAKAILDKNDYLKLKQCLYNQTKQELFDEIKDKNINKATLQAMLQASLKHKHIEIENENEIEIDNSNDINFSLLLSFLDTAVNSLPEDKARESRIFHNAVYDLLLEQGYECKYEYPIPNGRIDILVILPNDELVAIELDNRIPRSKNILKTEGLNMRFISILRDPYPNKNYSQFNIDGVVQYKKRFTSSLEPVEEYEFYPFEEFWNDYDKKVGEKGKLSKKWEKVSVKDRKAIKEYIPKYKSHQPDKKFRKNPETFLNNKGWNDELISALPVVRGQIKPQKGVSIADTQRIYEELTGNYGHR